MSLEKASSLFPVFFLVPQAKDSCHTDKALQEVVSSHYILSAPEGDGLNFAVTALQERGFTHVAVVSNKASHFITKEIMDEIIVSLQNGARVVGVVLPELENIIEKGRVQNTFAVWDISSLQSVGGFDSEIGVEEITPSIRLVRQHGPCIGVVCPKNLPGFVIRPGDEARHEEIIRTKQTRQEQEAARIGASLDELVVGLL